MANNLADGFILQHDSINVKPPKKNINCVIINLAMGQVNKNSSKESSSWKRSEISSTNKVYCGEC